MNLSLRQGVTATPSHNSFGSAKSAGPNLNRRVREEMILEARKRGRRPILPVGGDGKTPGRTYAPSSRL